MQWDTELACEDRRFYHSHRERDYVGQNSDAGIKRRAFIDELVTLGQLDGRYRHRSLNKKGTLMRVDQQLYKVSR